jgi:hypothetical protein
VRFIFGVSESESEKEWRFEEGKVEGDLFSNINNWVKASLIPLIFK